MSDVITRTQEFETPEEALAHYGVKGMKWGVRKGDYEGASRATNREASRDAKEFARAKMFYGEGAGTRRKLIKAKIEAKAKKDPTYKKAFDHHLAKQDLGKHASKARRERRRKDVVSGTAKTARGVHRELNGGFGNTSLGSKVLAEAIRATRHADDIEAIDFSSMTYDEAMAHYGVKGMKWGVRKDQGHEGERVKTKQLAKLDKKWEKANTGQAGMIKAHNAMAQRMNSGMIDKFNEDPRWKDVDISSDAKLMDTYMAEFTALSDKVFREETVKLGSNPSGSKKFVMETDENGNEYVVLKDVREAQHAEDDVPSAFKITRNRLGHISSLEAVENTLKHYGVKGMRWGVTTNPDGSVTVDQTRVRKSLLSSDKAVTVTQRKPGTYVKSHGGKRQTASTDAVRAQANRQKAKRSTTDSLSNRELKATIERMRLEQEYAKLDKKVSRKGASFAETMKVAGEMARAVKDVVDQSRR